FKGIIAKGEQIVHKLSSNICESMNSLKTKYMPKRLNMRVQYILRINMAILAKHIPGECSIFINSKDWRQKLLEQCEVSLGERSRNHSLEQAKRKMMYSSLKNTEERKKS